MFPYNFPHKSVSIASQSCPTQVLVSTEIHGVELWVESEATERERDGDCRWDGWTRDTGGGTRYTGGGTVGLEILEVGLEILEVGLEILEVGLERLEVGLERLEVGWWD